MTNTARSGSNYGALNFAPVELSALAPLFVILIDHIGKDALVGWAWKSGFGRSPAPGTQEQAGALVEAWVKTGAACPAP